MVKIWEKNERQRTANFCVCHPHCDRQSGAETKWSLKSSYIVSGIPLTMWGTNRNEDAYCLKFFPENSWTQEISLLSFLKYSVVAFLNSYFLNFQASIVFTKSAIFLCFLVPISSSPWVKKVTNCWKDRKT